jgi:G6PDH family F420-dependent oxidoreductase
MLVEAATIIRELQSGDLVTWEGDYFRVDSARVWDAPEGGVPIAIAVSGEKSVAQFAPLADHLVAVEPEPDLIKAWDHEKGSANTRKIGQVPICWDLDEQRAIKRAHDQFRWFAGGWAVNADLPTPAGFEGASTFVRPEDVAKQIPCGPDLDAAVQAIQPFWEAGFTDIAIVQVGDEGQREFLDQAAKPLLERAAKGRRLTTYAAPSAYLPPMESRAKSSCGVARGTPTASLGSALLRRREQYRPTD